MSQINTNGINVNYPVPGQNNSSQPFRDNFAAIRTNINTAATELTDLESKVVVKAALNNTTLNNDMANTLISNASTRGFRATTYNLGNALSGTILVDVNRADVQYGAVTGNTTLQFGGWAPTNTESNVVLRLTISNTAAVISLPSACVSSNNNYGVTILENYANIGNTATITAPANVGIMEYTFSSLDCGNTITVSPVNRAFQTAQIITRDPPPTGLMGDVNGDVAVSASVSQIRVTQTANVPTVITANTFTSTGSTIVGTELTIGTLATGNVSIGMILSGAAANTYITGYTSGSGSGSKWVVNQSQSVSSGPIDGKTGIYVDAVTNNPVLYVGVQTSGVVQEGMILSGSGVTANTWIVQNLAGSGSGSLWRVSTSQWATPTTINGAIDVLTVANTSGFYRDMPLTFTGNTFGGANLLPGNTYYIKEVADSNSITISATPSGSMVVLANASGNMYLNPGSYLYVATNKYNSTTYARQTTNTTATTNLITLENTTYLEVNSPIIFTGSTFGGLEGNVVYYVKSNDLGNSKLTVSRTRVNGIAGPEVLLTTANGNCVATCYTGGNDIWKRISLTAW